MLTHGSADAAWRSPNEPYEPQVTVRGVKWLLFARLAVAITIVVYLLVSQRGWGESFASRMVYGVVLGVLILNAFYLLLLRQLKNRRRFVRGQLALDVILIALMVHLTGGVRSQLLVLFPLIVMAAALLLFWLDTVVFTVEAVAAYVAVALLGMTALAPMQAVAPREAFASMVAHVFGISAVALLSVLLVHRLSVARLVSRDILDVVGQGIIISDSRDRILFVNREARRLLGGGAQVGARTLSALPEEVRREMRFDGVTGESVAHSVAIEIAPGETVPVSASAKPVLSDSDRVVGTLMVLTDRSLEQRVEEAKFRAQRSEAVSEMAAAIAHEIRNPLAAIRSSVQEIGRRLLGQEKCADDGLFDIVLSESDRLDAIITDFLAFAKMPAVHPGPCNLGEIVREAAVLIRQTAEDPELDVRVEAPDELRIRADGNKIRQVLLNVGLNSVDALAGRPERRIVMRAASCAYLDFPLRPGIAKRSAAGERAGVQLDVEDTGCGMLPEVRLRAMDPFFTQKESGTGLGLAVVDRIMKAHGGLIRMESEPNRGTAFRLWLPLDQ